MNGLQMWSWTCLRAGWPNSCSCIVSGGFGGRGFAVFFYGFVFQWLIHVAVGWNPLSGYS